LGVSFLEKNFEALAPCKLCLHNFHEAIQARLRYTGDMKLQRALPFFAFMVACGTATPAPISQAAPSAQVVEPTVVYLPTIIRNHGSPTLGGCPMFPADNEWNRDISADPVDPNSNNYINYILNSSNNDFLHADFGENQDYGIPYVVVPQNQPLAPITFTGAGDESDPGPYPIPPNAPIEGGPASDGDRHVLVLRQGECKLYELYYAFPVGGGWEAYSGAIFDLNSNALRPLGWTSADAAGLPILPGLVRYDEVAAGVIKHALRFTVSQTQRAYILPATHAASTITHVNAPPMGLRLRLKASYNLNGFTGQALVILEALKRYGLILADNGSNWYITGATDPRWVDDDLNQLKTVPGSAFEVVKIKPGTLCSWPQNVCQ